ncbi:MAG: response regulator transcription factor [Bacteroidia bacterium]|nr:response regulator transcription factor [Bacteroidia bacterium]
MKTKERNISIMVADDHNLGRQSFSSYLETNCEGVKITGQAANGLELLELMKKKAPDIVILDLEMPVMNGHQTLLQITKRYPKVKTIIFSTHYNEYFISELMIAGACGYLSKSCFAEEMFETIDKVYNEGFYFNNTVSRQVVTTLIEERKLQYLISEKILSEREIDVLKEICNEKQGKEIADALKISENTVQFHKKIFIQKQIAKRLLA